MKICFLYGGQGSQQEKMGYDFYLKNEIVKSFYDGVKIEKSIMDYFNMNEDNLKKTDNAQMALILYEIALTKLLKERIKPSATAGLSIGEYAALYCAGILSEKDTVDIAQFRGKEMLKAMDFESKMCAVMKTEEEELVKICNKSSLNNEIVEISNINTKNQIVISGHINAVNRALKELEKENKKTVELNVKGAFHTKYMNSVEESLRNYFKELDFKNSETDLYYNLTGNIETDNIKEIMAKQVSQCVRFKDIINNLLNDGYDTFIEIGYSKVLNGFIKKINRNVKVYSISDYESYEQFIKEFK